MILAGHLAAAVSQINALMWLEVQLKLCIDAIQSIDFTESIETT